MVSLNVSLIEVKYCLWRSVWLGKVGLATSEAGGAQITHVFTNLFDSENGANESLEGALEILRQIEPVLGFDIEPLKDGRQAVVNRPALVFPNDSAGPIDQFQVVG